MKIGQPKLSETLRKKGPKKQEGFGEEKKDIRAERALRRTLLFYLLKAEMGTRDVARN